MASVCELRNRLRELSLISLEYKADFTPTPHVATELRGYSEATISLAVFKKVNPPEFAVDQAKFMIELGTHVCPKILAINSDSYCMEYLHPAEFSRDSLIVQERFLEQNVWNRGKIHGDPTLDNVLMTRQGLMRITDPIPPQWLRKPSVIAVDQGKILQSLLGWEVVLRGVQLIEYDWPKFMSEYNTAKKSIYWAKVAVERIAKRDIFDSATQWATRVAEGLESCTLSS